MNPSKFLRLLWKAIFPPPPKIYYVESDEPFKSKPVTRGPFTQEDAQRLIGIQAACGCTNRRFIDKGNGKMVRG